MPSVNTNGVEIAYERHGSAAGPTLLLIQGLGMPLAAWPPMLVEKLTAEGFQVITFDNRDVGQSQQLSAAGLPNVVVQAMRRAIGLRVRAPYQLDDMARDAVGLMDRLGIDSAHVIGVSMGGMIAQLVAIDAPARVTSLTSIMSTTGNRRLPGATRRVSRFIMRGPRGRGREARMNYHRALWPLIGSPDYPLRKDELEQFLQRIFDRGMTEQGTGRQLLAIMAAPNRVPRLRQLTVPTLLVHGVADPLIPIAGSYDMAAAMPHAEMFAIEGMGHDLPEALLPRISGHIVRHVRQAESPAR